MPIGFYNYGMQLPEFRPRVGLHSHFLRGLCARNGTPYFVLALALAALSLPVVVFAGKNFVKPVAKTASNYPAHDFHRDEKVAIAADPYDNPEKAKIFSINYAEHGFLPIFLIVTNDGDQPVSIANMQIKLITEHNSKLTPIDADDLYRRLSNPQAKTSTNNPLPFPHKVKGGITQQEKDEIESSQFAAKAVEPHTTQSGFLFFDVADLKSPLRGANIDITGVADAKGSELMFFEIPMDNYVDAPKNPESNNPQGQ